jgi:hypothetical protein
MEWENTRLVIPFELQTKALMNKAVAKTRRPQFRQLRQCRDV